MHVGKGAAPSRNDRVPRDDRVQGMTAFTSSSAEKQEDRRRRRAAHGLTVPSAVSPPPSRSTTPIARTGSQRTGERQRGSHCDEQHRRESTFLGWAGTSLRTFLQSDNRESEGERGKTGPPGSGRSSVSCRNATFLAHSRSQQSLAGLSCRNIIFFPREWSLTSSLGRSVLKHLHYSKILAFLSFPPSSVWLKMTVTSAS